MAIAVLVAAVILFMGKILYNFFKEELSLAEQTREKNAENFNDLDYFYYRIDYLFSRSSNFKIFCLLFITVCLIAVGGIMVWLATFDHLGECFWQAWTFIADPGMDGWMND
jgi:hypothetical protein